MSEEDNWKPVATAAANWLQAALKHGNTIITSDNRRWVAELNQAGVLKLWHRESNTISVISRGCDGLLIPESFRFLGRQKERDEANEPLVDELFWGLQHRRMMGV